MHTYDEVVDHECRLNVDAEQQGQDLSASGRTEAGEKDDGEGEAVCNSYNAEAGEEGSDDDAADEGEAVGNGDDADAGEEGSDDDAADEGEAVGNGDDADAGEEGCDDDTDEGVEGRAPGERLPEFH